MIDDIDRELIVELQEDGRRSYVELAEHLHISEATARSRVKRLLARDLLKVTAVPNLSELGFQFVSIVGIQVRLRDLKSIVDELKRHPAVSYLVNVTGHYDLIGIIVTRSSREFADFIESTVSIIPGIDRTESFVSLRVIKGETIATDALAMIDVRNAS